MRFCVTRYGAKRAQSMADTPQIWATLMLWDVLVCTGPFLGLRAPQNPNPYGKHMKIIENDNIMGRQPGLFRTMFRIVETRRN